MPDTDVIADHYTHGRLVHAIRAGVEGLGKSPDTVTVEDLGPVDEFHIGGRAATESFLEQLNLSPDDHVLDVGCGLGGASRFVAQRYGSRVTGIDLTPEYIETGRVLCTWVGLADRIALDYADATAMPFPDATFSKAFMMHVGMNIGEKPKLFAELHRILKPGGHLGIYDVMRTGDGELVFPVPWAISDKESVVVSPGEYKDALTTVGFRIIAERNRQQFALDFFARLQADTADAKGLPPLGLHILMGQSASVKVKNMIENVSQNRVAPVELIAERKP